MNCGIARRSWPAGLKNLGIARGDRVAIRLGNGLDWCIAFWGTLMSGAVVVPVNTRFAEPEVEYVINDSGSRFVFLPGQPLPAGAPSRWKTVAQPISAAIFYTSGTTGFPEGRHDHAREFSFEYRNVPAHRATAHGWQRANAGQRAAVSRHWLQQPTAYQLVKAAAPR